MPRPLLFLIPALALVARAGSAAPVDFAKEIAPIFSQRCIRCHNAEEKKGKWSLATAAEFFKKRGGHEDAVIRGDPENSLLVDLVSPQGKHDAEMPKEGDPLTRDEVALVRRWVAEGAPWPEGFVIEPRKRGDKNWWSLQPLRAPKDAADGSPIDRLLLAKLQENGLLMNPPADPRDLIRRATFDLTGLPPSPEEVEAFVRACAVSPAASEEAYAALLDRLLASPRYGEQWGRHWLDVVRFGESTGFERNIIHEDAWPFRDYVIRSLNDDKPFDRFILEHLAGDQLAPGDPAIEVGTGFLVAGPYDNVGNQDVKAQAQIRANTLDDVITATGSAFLGLTVHCARCHDHKFDPIPQADYYRLQAAFAGVQQGARPLATAEEREAAAAKRKPFDKEMAALKAELAALTTRPEGAPALTPEEEARKAELLARQPVLEKQIAKAGAVRKAWIGIFNQPSAATYLMKGGDPQKRGEEIAPASLAVLEVAPKYTLALNAPEVERRLALARWIVAAENPLTPRVLANRVWHWHFGTGIVDTPSDFGYMGGRPTHPALLDYLALRLQANGWRLKPLHREIMLSQAYRQSSAWRKDGADHDHDARWLWRFPPRRLSAEELRDSMLAVAGKLDLEKSSGPGFRLYRYLNDNVSTYEPLDKVGPETYRRAVFHQNARASTVDLMTEFDAPDCAFSTPRRSSTTTPLQALTLLNHSFTVDMSNALTERLRAEGGTEIGAQVRRGIAFAYGRKPTAAEQTAAERVVAAHGLPAFCRALLNSNELLYLP
jgi:mono/diheme cytochrome c family protein